jgi:hypothetical protein
MIICQVSFNNKIYYSNNKNKIILKEIKKKKLILTMVRNVPKSLVPKEQINTRKRQRQVWIFFFLCGDSRY